MWVYEEESRRSGVWKMWVNQREQCWLFYRHKSLDHQHILWASGDATDFIPRWVARPAGDDLHWDLNPYCRQGCWRYDSPEQCEKAWERLSSCPESFIVRTML